LYQHSYIANYSDSNKLCLTFENCCCRLQGPLYRRVSI